MSASAKSKRATRPRRKPARPAGAAALPAEAEQILNAIRSDEIDALVIRKGVSEKIVALTSVDDLERADTARLALERRFDTLAAHAPVGIFINDFDGGCLYINQRGCEIAGIAPEQALGQGLVNAVHPEDQERVKRETMQATAAGIPFESEYRIRAPGGKVVWVARKSAPLMGEGGKQVARIGTIMDITGHKLAEEALRESREQLRSLLDQRERLTQDLHDGCIQSLYAVGLNLQSSRQKLDGSPEAARIVASATANLNLVIQELRAFISGKGPEGAPKPDLALEIERFGQSARDRGMKFELRIDSAVANALGADQAHQLLQIAREAISNAARHAKAKSLWVGLRSVDGSICLEIADDGIGFNPRANQKSGLGLHHIEARARALRGDAKILSTTGGGTRIVVQVPLPR